GIRDRNVTGVQTCALPISVSLRPSYQRFRKLTVCATSRFRLQQRATFMSTNRSMPTKHIERIALGSDRAAKIMAVRAAVARVARSEERRVGKECRRGEGAG